MTWQTSLSEADWAILGDAPLAAGAAVALASAGGGRSEASAMISSWREASQQVAHSALMAELFARFDPERPSSGSGAGYAYATIIDEAVGLCSQAMSLLRRHDVNPEDLEAYRSFVITMAEGVAAAHHEGGLFARLGNAISPEERVVLGAIAQALGYRRV